MRRKLAPLAVLACLLAGCAAPVDSTVTTATDTTSTADGAAVTTDTNSTKVGPADYKIRVKVLSKQCFGTAGCNVTARLSVTGLTTATESTPAELTVVVKGADDGAFVETITLDGNGDYLAPEVFVSTPSKTTKLTAKVTEVMTTDG